MALGWLTTSLTPLAFAYIVSLMASLVVAIFVTPALCFAFLPHVRSIETGHDGWLSRNLKTRFGRGGSSPRR